MKITLRNRIARTAALSALTLALALSLTPALSAQSGGRGANASDRLARLLFSPEMVMRHRTELGLTEAQKDTLIREMQAAQSDLVPIQFEMAEISGELARMLSRPKVDEDEVVAAANEVMALEARIKTRHLILSVRIKNILTIDQQSKLRMMRRRQWEQRRNGGER